MERKERESDEVRVKCAEKRTAMGYKITRHLTLAEGKQFLASGLYPASGLAPSTFKQAKELTALPPGATCMCCGHDLTGQPGWVVEIAAPSGATYKTICAADYETVMSGKSDAPAQEPAQPAQEPAQETPSAPAPAVAPSASSPAEEKPEPSASENSVEAALETLAAALAAKSAPPPAPSIDKAEIVAEAVKAAKEEAKGFMQKSIADFIRDGGATAASGDGGEPVEEAGSVPASATGDGVEAAANASSWSAKATPKAVDAVEKLNKFLSEFSYFRAGVSMRLVNTFARAYDKAEALRSYCEVSQMEDLPDLVEKMKSPEFDAVCNAFAEVKTPQPLNKRFAVFYGAPGGGKTYAAIKAGESINGGAVDVVPCSPSMDAADMLYAYRLDYKSGRRGYVPTALLTAMVAGRAVILDEINLLPMEARMFLQDILDNKGKVHLMGVEIPIREGFFVLGTMNLETGLGATPLPLPLVDRASVVREFRTTTAQAAVGAGLC